MANDDSISKQLHVCQGILLRIYNPSQMVPNRRKVQPPAIVLLESLIDMIIDSEHIGSLAAHLSPKRVFLTLRDIYHFPQMESRVNSRIKQCLPCQLNMYTTNKLHKLHMTTHTTKPRSIVGINIAPDSPQDRGFHHIIVFVDFASNHVSIRLLRTRTSREILERFKDYSTSRTSEFHTQ